MSTDVDETVFTIVLNSLAFSLLNSVPYEPSENIEEALDGVAHYLRRGSLAIALGLNEIATAIREMKEV